MIPESSSKRGLSSKRSGLVAALLVLLAPGVASSIADPGFELLPVGTDLGTSQTFTADLLSRWGIDSALVVAAENGVTPADGSQMARANVGAGTDLYTLVDVTHLAVEIAAQEARVDVSALFNALSPNEFHVSLRAFTGPFDFGFPAQFGAESSDTLFSDGDSATWEPAALTDYVVPLDTVYLAVGLHALFDEANPSYMDGAEIVFRTVPEPESVALALCGALALAVPGLRAARRRRLA